MQLISGFEGIELNNQQQSITQKESEAIKSQNIMPDLASS